MIVSIDQAEAVQKIQHLFMMKILSKLRIEGNMLNLIKNTSKKSAANIILNGEKVEVLPLLETRQGCSPLHSFPTEVLDDAIRQAIITGLKDTRLIYKVHHFFIRKQ